ncbi:MAG: putative selenium-dependent hydroxylase accessory protein YqeC [Chloroflexi bacterium]|jgi:molybdenum cofactor cytidylyltransferase|nr:putative selenium-dependent hydroxylase accessory protein YqeC [Chloroflexota bacterium]
MRLVNALRLTGPGPAQRYPPPCTALTGAGGKSTALFRLGRELARERGVLLTASTHLAVEQLQQADRHMVIHSPADLKHVQPPRSGEVLLLTGPPGADERTSGLAPAALDVVNELTREHQLPLLLEADGSRRLPLKAPGEHEPAVPAWVNQVVVVAGLTGLGRPLDAAWVHRPERFAALSGIDLQAAITVGALSSVLASPEGGLKGIPDAARRILLLNQADTHELQAAGANLARRLVPPYSAAVVSRLQGTAPDEEALAVYEPAAGIILAAGGASRLGKPKQLLEWKGEPFVRAVARTALEAGLAPVIVVTGAAADEVQQALSDLPVQFVHNPDWESGQGSSVATGARSLPPECGAAVYLLSDQPQIPAALVRSLVELHSRTLAPLTAPLADGRRANPVLFDRVTFGELQQLSGETGGRSLFARYRPEWLPWHDASILLDVDTEQDYQRLLESDAA